MVTLSTKKTMNMVTKKHHDENKKCYNYLVLWTFSTSFGTTLNGAPISNLEASKKQQRLRKL